jgi:beta-fructofuranosidase
MEDALAMKVKIPGISCAYINVYQPAGDVFPGPSTGPLEAGRHYDEWVANDHCFVRDAQGRWHVFGITHPKSGLEDVHAGEYQSFHALAPKGALKDVLRKGAWKDEPKILPPSQRKGEMPENHAPCIFKVDGIYHMIYGPSPLRHATSTDLYDWVPRGPLANSLITRDPNVFFWNDVWHVLTCGVADVRMATLENFSACGQSRVILKMKDGVDPESPTLIHHAGTFYLFVCDWNYVWDRKDLQGAYQHITRVYQSDDPFHFDVNREIAQIKAHAPEIFKGDTPQGDSDRDWYISSAEWPYRGISIAPLEWCEAL